MGRKFPAYTWPNGVCCGHTRWMLLLRKFRYRGDQHKATTITTIVLMHRSEDRSSTADFGRTALTPSTHHHHHNITTVVYTSTPSNTLTNFIFFGCVRVLYLDIRREQISPWCGYSSGVFRRNVRQLHLRAFDIRYLQSVIGQSRTRCGEISVRQRCDTGMYAHSCVQRQYKSCTVD